MKCNVFSMPLSFGFHRRVSNSCLIYLMLVFVLAILAILAYTLASYQQIPLPQTSFLYRPGTVSPRDAAANRTLGFEKILVLSKAPSWRTRGLYAAADYTGLDVEVPEQPQIPSELVVAFQKIGPDNATHPPYGSAHAWLAHLDMIKHAIAANLRTVLILEDDVDWDIMAKSQMRLVSDAVRNFTGVAEEDKTPYGGEWDVLWLGHCGEVTHPGTPRLEFADPTCPPAENYTGWGKGYVKNLGAGKRAVQKAGRPVCTFGYAMTRIGMHRVLEWAGKGQSEAFDIKLLRGCQSKDLDCLTVTPELMHHYTPSKQLGYVSLVAVEDGKGTPDEEEMFEKVMGTTENILNSARCQVLFNRTCLKK